MRHQLTEKAKGIIAANVYMCVATADERPWAAPVFFAFDSNYRMYFISAVDSLHARHILKNPAVAAAIYSTAALPGEGDGVQIDGIAEEVPEVELPHAIATYYRRRFPDDAERATHNLTPKRFTGNAPLRVFRFIPAHVYTLDSRRTDADRRIEVRLT